MNKIKGGRKIKYNKANAPTVSIPEFMDTCDLDRNTMYKYLKEGMPYRRADLNRGIVIDFEKARKWMEEQDYIRENENENNIKARIKQFVFDKIKENKLTIILVLSSLFTLISLGIIISLLCKISLYKNTIEGLSNENEFLQEENAKLIDISERYSYLDAETLSRKSEESLEELKKQYPNVPIPALSLIEIIDVINLYGNSILLQTEKDKEKINNYLLRETLTPRGWPVEGEITSYFGQRYCERGSVLSRTLGYIGWKYHSGIDIAAPILTPVCATADGIVIFVGMKSSYGNLIIIEHGGVYRTLYGHLSHFTIENGKEVKRGDLIGGIGKTGRVTGPHLHYEVHVLDDSGKGLAVNPLPYVKN